jgi:GNAT superfamily N-acetyltransferase
LSALDTFFDRGGTSTGTVVIFGLWPEPDLRRFGWRLLGHPPAHVRPPGAATPSDPPGVEIVPVTTIDELHEWERTAIHAYPFAECQAAPPGSIIAERLLDDSRRRFWIARLDGKPAGVASALIDHGLNYVPLVATMPEARGRGIGTALTWRATLAEPSLPSALLSSDEGRPIYDRMGYLPLIRMTLWYRLRLGF